MRLGGIVSILVLQLAIALAAPVPTLLEWLDEELFGKSDVQHGKNPHHRKLEDMQWLNGDGPGSGSESGLSNYAGTANGSELESNANDDNTDITGVMNLSGSNLAEESALSGGLEADADPEEEDEENEEQEDKEESEEDETPSRNKPHGLSQPSDRIPAA